MVQADVLVILLMKNFGGTNSLHICGKPKISYYQLPFLVYQQVLWLDVSVHNTMLMQVVQTVYQLYVNGPCESFRKLF